MPNLIKTLHARQQRPIRISLLMKEPWSKTLETQERIKHRAVTVSLDLYSSWLNSAVRSNTLTAPQCNQRRLPRALLPGKEATQKLYKAVFEVHDSHSIQTRINYSTFRATHQNYRRINATIFTHGVCGQCVG